MRSPDLAERFAREGAEVIASSQDQFAKHLRAEMERWGKVIKQRGMRAE